jgi:hypothetical protein
MSRAPAKKPAGDLPPQRHTASLLGHVEAPDAETAIREAIDEFRIDPAFHKLLFAQRRA